MPTTTPDGLPYESLTNDEPTSTLNGGSSGTADILAAKVQAALTDIRGDIADLQPYGRGLVAFDENPNQVEVAASGSTSLILIEGITLETGRRYRVEASSLMNRSTGSGDTWGRLVAELSGGIGQVGRGMNQAANSTISRAMSCILLSPPFTVPSSGTYDLDLIASVSANEGINFGGATDPPVHPTFMAIYDIGAA